MKHLVTFLYAVLAGAAISIGGAAFLASDSRAVGAALFSVGLFAVCTLGLNLFTGRVCYVFDNPPAYTAQCALIWLGNLAGAWLSGGALTLTRLDWSEKAASICRAKLDDSLLSLFILAVFCNILIYLAVESYKNNPHPLGKYLVGGLGVHIDQQGRQAGPDLLHRHQVISRLACGIGAALQVDGAPGKQQLPAPPGVLHVDRLHPAVQLHLGDEAVGPGEEPGGVDVLVDHVLSSPLSAGSWAGWGMG